MSICGRVATDPEMPLPVERMLRAVTIGAARSQRQWSGAGIRLGAGDEALLATAPHDRGVVFDGELHNRAELAAALGLPSSSDATLVIAAYDAWGEAFADRLVGDFSCAIWDSGERRLLLVTDPGAMRPLHYWHRAGELRFATDARALWAEPDVDRVLDDARVAQWLCLTGGDEGQTFFKGIHRVPPGNMVVWRNGKLRTARWWRPEALPELRLARDDDYVAALREAFERAVTDRLSPGARIGSHLSGGLDSSAVTAFAAQALAQGGQRLTAFTAAPAHAAPTSAHQFGDEWGHAAAVAALYSNVDHIRISNDDMPLLDVLELREGMQDTPLLNPANMVWANGIDREARDRGITVMLTGSMGNMTFSYTGAALLAQQLRRGRFVRAARTLLAQRRSEGMTWKGTAATLATGMLPKPWIRRLREIGGRTGPKLFDYVAITPAFLRDSGLEAVEDMRIHTTRGDSRAMRVAVFRQSDFRGDYARASRRLYGIDTRDPTLDRRLFELCLSIPEEQFALNGVSRSLARRMLARDLPGSVSEERRKGRQAADWAVPFDAALPGLKAEVARLRATRSAPAWIDLDRIERALDRWPGAAAAAESDAAANEYQFAISRALATGRFVRKFEGSNA